MCDHRSITDQLISYICVYKLLSDTGGLLYGPPSYWFPLLVSYLLSLYITKGTATYNLSTVLKLIMKLSLETHKKPATSMKTAVYKVESFRQK